MLKNMRLRTRLLVIGIVMSAIPLVVVSSIVCVLNARIVGIAEEGCTRSVSEDLNHITQSIYNMCKTQQETLETLVTSSLNVAREVVREAGGIRLSDETVTWDVVSRQNRTSQSVQLPRMLAGETWLGKVQDASATAPIVDRAQSLTQTVCMIFQRMNDAGDMLCVCTKALVLKPAETGELSYP